MNPYSQDFYLTRHTDTIHSADAILSVLLEHIPPVHSAIDVGCGVGTWLSVLQARGVADIQGLDGGWVDEDLLVIPRECFRQVDLARSGLVLPRRFDLALSLEVAEHLPAERAREFVAFLATLSDYVLFSAAIPYQGGRSHVNEQWQHYWAELFGALSYSTFDIIRPRIWGDSRIPFWYRQNILLFSRHKLLESGPAMHVDAEYSPILLDVVHPDLYLKRAGARIALRSGRRLLAAITGRLRR